MNPVEAAAAIRRAALEFGYVRCGFTTADPFPEYLAAVRRAAEHRPASAALYERFLARGDPRRDAPWARTIVVAVRRFGIARLPRQAVGRIGRNY